MRRSSLAGALRRATRGAAAANHAAAEAAVAVELLRAQESLLEPEEVGSAWEEAIRGDPCSVMLRMESLAHASRHAAAGGEPPSAVDALQRGALLLLLRAAYAERAAGFSERELLQAAVELNCFCPPALLAAPLGERLDAFAEFWESEAPRVG
ncbi:hypothetical protein EMIHUDRAFT_233282 [Emiliania huxleyi CCMP1516]|uniref:CTLH domain-containing protein n=2 Tax=Emiliania huxleyi TaxID=2903 RepID=A0A0D3K2C5_EMIH1|nr:hypothetical protein EMIHUDRAFT_233282 [Emiliania huxleyi CCMP1516]EOD29910.1 hypothetical protein EMIHUDRAFT_233282 [Emiliania huxleyi CCMP1516]|eukprot:XP_005782339.1 hypothetical protein EMIHUDRAFT_233282 [Emiliania huxleyi CCMP1516]